MKQSLLIWANKSFAYRYMAYIVHKRACLSNPEREIARSYYASFGRLPNLTNPQNLIEKIRWMGLHCDMTQWTLLADKYRMREYVSERGCSPYLPKLYGVWNNPKDIEWSALPEQFVIKANNGCGTVLVVKDKNEHSSRQVKRMLRQWLAIPYGYRGYQPHYLGIRPCILAEELLKQDDSLNKLSPQSMVDFKVWCFNGRVESIFVAYNRLEKSLSCDLYDGDWNRLLDCIRCNGHYVIHPEVSFPRPECLEEMKEVASKLSKGHPQMRVDFYVVDGHPVLGELTMSTGYGYFTDEYYNYLGDLTDLSMMKVIDGTPLSGTNLGGGTLIFNKLQYYRQAA